MNSIDTITAGQTFTTNGTSYTAVADAKIDTLNTTGGYMVEVTTGTEESFYLLFGSNDMVLAA